MLLHLYLQYEDIYSGITENNLDETSNFILLQVLKSQGVAFLPIS